MSAMEAPNEETGAFFVPIVLQREKQALSECSGILAPFHQEKAILVLYVSLANDHLLQVLTAVKQTVTHLLRSYRIL